MLGVKDSKTNMMFSIVYLLDNKFFHYQNVKGSATRQKSSELCISKSGDFKISRDFQDFCIKYRFLD